MCYMLQLVIDNGFYKLARSVMFLKTIREKLTKKAATTKYQIWYTNY